MLDRPGLALSYSKEVLVAVLNFTVCYFFDLMHNRDLSMEGHRLRAGKGFFFQKRSVCCQSLPFLCCMWQGQGYTSLYQKHGQLIVITGGMEIPESMQGDF